MIIDSHCHAWHVWPFQPAVPDPHSRGTVEQLLWEMDRHGVEQAVVICAGMDDGRPQSGRLDNAAYVVDCARRYPGRLHPFVDVDCAWSPAYHTPGAAGRLRELTGRYGVKGFTHYVQDDTAWLLTAEGIGFFETAAELGLIASLALGPLWQPGLRQIARRFPTLPILCHHMGGIHVDDLEGVREVLLSAQEPNIYVKLSGFHYVSEWGWDFPHRDSHPLVQLLYKAYGPRRLCWGSDYPVVRGFLTYQQALETFRTHCDFIPETDHADILGDNMQRLLDQARSRE